jgi:hypothetical protein
MGLRIIEHFDGSFDLAPEIKTQLFELLNSPAFLHQVAQAMQWQGSEFTELLFQPVPYSTATPKGMPAEFEKFQTSPDHTIVNVPPNFMFKAKVFKPSRLCAIYRKTLGEPESGG